MTDCTEHCAGETSTAPSGIVYGLVPRTLAVRVECHSLPMPPVKADCTCISTGACLGCLMVSPLARNARVNRTKIVVAGLHDRGGEVRFWRRQPVVKRLEGVELLRQTAHRYDPAAARLPRLLAVAKR
jgi:hypothetical protein